MSDIFQKLNKLESYHWQQDGIKFVNTFIPCHQTQQSVLLKYCVSLVQFKFATTRHQHSLGH